MPRSTFTIATKAMQVVQRPAMRERILAKALTPEEAALVAVPIEDWKTTTREEYAAYTPFMRHPKTPDGIPRADMKDRVQRKIGVYAGPVTHLAVDAVVNAANEVLLGGGGVDGAIHRAAGPLLQRECAALSGCPTGQAVITRGYNLPAPYVIHTVGPIGEQPSLLRSCYQSVLGLAVANGLRSMGLCGISTGVYGYPLPQATKIAVEEVTSFVREHDSALDFVCFACFTDEELAAVEDELRRVRQDVV